MVAVSSLQRMNVYDLSVIELSARGLLLCAKIKSLDGSKNIIYIYMSLFIILSSHKCEGKLSFSGSEMLRCRLGRTM